VNSPAGQEMGTAGSAEMGTAGSAEMGTAGPAEMGTAGPADTGAAGGSAAAASVGVATADDMRALGQRLAGLLHPGDLVVLSGPLGAGKTTLAAGIGQGLNVRGPVTSPTFVIARVHPPLSGGPALVHADAYRLASPAEVDDLDLDADVSSSVTVVEWGEGLVEGLAADRLDISIAISRTAGPGSPADLEAGLGVGLEAGRRTVRISGVGERWAAAAMESVRCALPPASEAL
jgi:tRNA threonylcarbamoyladenosine biosynthesis protein TsaE